jgi:cysteine synthase
VSMLRLARRRRPAQQRVSHAPSTRLQLSTLSDALHAQAARGSLPPTQQHPSAFEQCVGNTRLIRLRGPSEATGCCIYGKAEYDNPGGSVKDRAALAMIKDAEERGILVRGEPGIVVEGTAGNTGIGLALAARTFGYETVICLADTQSQEKKDQLRWAGATLVEVPAVPFRNPNNYVHVAARLAEALADHQRSAHARARVFYANQWDNLANRNAHYDGTGPEIRMQLAAVGVTLDAFSCAMGTGGTLSGCAEYFREVSFGNIRIGLTDPEGAAIVNYHRTGQLASQGSSISEGIGQGRITGERSALHSSRWQGRDRFDVRALVLCGVTGNMEGFKPDDGLIFEIPDAEMLHVLQKLQSEDGLAVGGSAGINVAGAMRVAQALGPGHTVATVLCDRAERYAGKLYNTDFLRAKGLPPPPWLDTPAVSLPKGMLESCLVEADE